MNLPFLNFPGIILGSLRINKLILNSYFPRWKEEYYYVSKTKKQIVCCLQVREWMNSWKPAACVNPELVLLARCSNCMFACACANCQSPDATVIFALLTPTIALLFIPDYRFTEGLSSRIPHNQSQDFSTTSSHNSSERSGSLSGWFMQQENFVKRTGTPSGALPLDFMIDWFHNCFIDLMFACTEPDI